FFFQQKAALLFFHVTGFQPCPLPLPPPVGGSPIPPGPGPATSSSMKAGLRKVISRPLISPVKSPRRRNSTGPTAAKVIRPATRPGVRLSRKPSWTHRPLLNFCATRLLVG